MEGIGDQRITHDKPHLALGHSRLQLVYHVLRNDIALLDVDLVDPKRTAGECEQTHKGEAGQQELGFCIRWWLPLSWLGKLNPDDPCINRSCEAATRKQTMVENSELRKAGLKVTLPRVKIPQMLDSSVSGQRHMSAEDVYKALMEAGEDVAWPPSTAADPVRGRRPGRTPQLRWWSCRIRAGRWRPPRSHGLRGFRRGHRSSSIRRSKLQKEIVKQHGFDLVDHNLVLYVRKRK